MCRGLHSILCRIPLGESYYTNRKSNKKSLGLKTSVRKRDMDDLEAIRRIAVQLMIIVGNLEALLSARAKAEGVSLESGPCEVEDNVLPFRVEGPENSEQV